MTANERGAYRCFFCAENSETERCAKKGEADGCKMVSASRKKEISDMGMIHKKIKYESINGFRLVFRTRNRKKIYGMHSLKGDKHVKE